jgi:hypothetical protein
MREKTLTAARRVSLALAKSLSPSAEPSLPLPNSPNPFFLGGKAGRRSRSQVNAAVVSQSFVVLPSAVQRETNQSAGHEAAHRTLGYFSPLVRCTMLLKITGDFFGYFKNAVNFLVYNASCVWGIEKGGVLKGERIFRELLAGG